MPNWLEITQTERTLVRWRTLILLRRIAHQVRTTLHGKFGVAAAIVMSFILVQIAIGGFVETIPKTVSGLDGLLFTTHIWLSVPLALMILCQFAKVFIKNRGAEPLEAHPSLSSALALHRTLSSIPFVSFAFTGLFFVYFWEPLTARINRLWIAIPIHLLSTGLLVLASAIIVGAVGRKVLRFLMKRGIQNVDLLVNVTGGFAIAVFMVLLVAIVVVNKYAVGVFETLGSSAAASYPLGMIPFAAALAADEGRWFAMFGWVGLSGALAFWAVRATHRWSFSAHREIPIDLATPVRCVFTAVFTGKASGRLPAGMSAFWRKDIIVPYSREPRLYLFHQVNLLWWGTTAVIIAMALRNRGSITDAFANTLPVVVTLAAMAVLSMQNGVNALGREGKELGWLRPILTGSQLFGRKLIVNLTYVLIHGSAYALVVYAASSAASLNTQVWILIAYAVCAGTTFSCVGTAIGFLLPDFEKRRSSLPGSTALGKSVYLLGSLALVGISGVAHLLLTAGAIDTAFYAGMLTFALLCTAILFALATAAAIRQYREMEI